MLPGKLEMSRDECRKYLRSLELDAYASMVSVLRAQGPFTNDKRKLLEELAGVLHISNERHRAEIRRAVNDDKLTTVAEQLSGSNTGIDWATEGRRLVPLIPRLKARNAFTTLANTLSLVTAMANQKQPLPEERAEDSRVKMESDSDVQQIFSSEEETSASSSIEPIEINFNDKKRKRSTTESSDTEGSTCAKGRLKHKPESSAVPDSNPEDPKFPSLSNPSCSKILEIPTSSSSLDAVRNTISNKTLSEEITHIASSTTNIVTSKNITVIPVGVSNVGTNSSAPCKNASNIATAQTGQYASTPIPTCIASAVKNKVNVLSSQVKTAVVGPRRISVSMPSNIAHPTTSKVEQSKTQNVQTNSDIDPKVVPLTNNVSKIEISRFEDPSTSRLCVKKIAPVVQTSAYASTTEQQTIFDISARLTSVSSESTTSSGPGPPCVTTSSTTLTCKTLIPVKPNSHPTAKMIPLNSKAINIDPQSKTSFGTKRSLIVLQKGMKRVMLSHGGKEARGKVISSVALVPRVPSNNGNQTDLECTKPSNKAGNKMVVLDIRQDVLEKNRVFSQCFETPRVFDTEAKTTALIPTNNFILKDQSNNGRIIIEKDSQLNDSSVVRLITSENQESHEKSLSNVYKDSDITSIIEKASEKEPLFIYNDEDTVIEGTLDPQTGIYETQSSDDAIRNIQYEETLSSSGLGIFNSTLESENINSESSQCTEGDNTSCASEEAIDSIVTIEKFNELSNS